MSLSYLHLYFKKIVAPVFFGSLFLLFGNCLFAQVPTIKSFTPNSICQGGTITISGTNLGGATVIKLGNSNATILTNNATTITATAGAASSGTVSVTTVGGTATSSGSITVNPNPFVGFTFSPNSQCPSVPVQFTNTSTGTGLAYLWDFGNPISTANSSNAKDPFHKFIGIAGNLTQSFLVKLTTTTNLGCSLTSSTTITTKQAPDLTLGPSTSVYDNNAYFVQCGSATTGLFNFTNLSSTKSTNTSYRIIWGDGTSDFTVNSSFSTTSHTYNIGTTPLTYIIAGSNGCIDTLNYKVFVGSNPGGSISSPSSTQGCTGETFSFPFANIQNNPPGTEYIVSVDDGSATEVFSHPPPATYTHTFNKSSCGIGADNTFTVSFTISNPCDKTPGTIGGIKISQKPVASFVIAPSDTVCENSIVTFTNTSVGNYIANGICKQDNSVWSISPVSGWSIVSGKLGDDFNLTDPRSWDPASDQLGISFTSVGTYTISIKIGGTPNSNCIEDFITKTICVNQLPVANFSVNNTSGCAPLSVSTTNNPSPTTCGNNTYNWSVNYSPLTDCLPNISGYSFINGTNANSVNPQFQFTNPGTYIISLITNGPGNSCSSIPFTQTITVKGKPNVTLAALSSTCQNQPVSPIATAGCNITSATYAWSFAGGTPGTSSSGLTPGSISFTTVGQHAVSLDVTNECGTTNASQQLTVNPPPAITGSFVNPSICASSTGSITISGATANTTYTVSYTQNGVVKNVSLTSDATGSILLNNLKAGTYANINIVLNGSCPSNNIGPFILSDPNPPETPTASSNAPFCSGNTLNLMSGTTTAGVSYSWSGPGNFTSSQQNPLIANASTLDSGIYNVSATLNGCTSASASVDVSINPLPPAPITASPLQLCQNATSVQLTATGSGLLWYSTEKGGAGSSTAPTPSTASIASADYYVSQTINSCESPRALLTVTVNALAVAPAVISPVNYCQNQAAAVLTATGSGLLWYTALIGGTGNSTAPTPSTTTVGSTNYYVSQTTGCGESPRDSIIVNVKAAPSATIAYSAFNLCNVAATASTPNPPVAAILTGTSGGNYTISPSGLSIDAITGTLTPSNADAGQYIVSYTIPGSGGCSDFITTATVNVNGSPTAAISYPSPICTSTAATNVTITGSQGGAFSSSPGLVIDPATGIINPSGSKAGVYTVTYTIASVSPCPGFTANASVIITQAPTATIAYIPANLCNVVNSSSTPNLPVDVTLTGTDGGSYTISPSTGLIIDASKGTLIPSGATPGTYIITYTIAGAGGCPDYTATASVTVSGAPTATINYPSSPYCQGINAPQPPVISGTSGGAFTSTTGLLLDATTGAINPSLTTPGIYTVTYTILPSPPCPGYIAYASVEIDESPVLSFSPSAKTICSGDTAIFKPVSSVANTSYTWDVVGALPAGVAGATSGTSGGLGPGGYLSTDIVTSFTNTGTSSQSITIAVTPTNPSQNPCAGTPYNLTVIVNPIPPAPAVMDTTSFCMGTPGTALTASALAGNTINWYDQNFVLLNAAPVINTSVPGQFIYYASQSNSFGCEGPKAMLIAIIHPTLKIISSTYTNPTTCGIPSGSIVLNVLDLNNNPVPNLPVIIHYIKFQTQYHVADSTDASGKIIVPLVAGTYSDIYVETSGCNSQMIPDVFSLKDPSPPAKPIAGYNAPLCSENVLNLSASSATSSQLGPVDYVWVGPAFGPFADTSKKTTVSFPSATVADAGTYIVYAIQNNCISPETSFQVDIKQSPSKPIITTKTPLCIGDDLNLQAYSSIPGPNTILNYLWTGPESLLRNQPNVAINNVQVKDGGIYSITVNSPQTGCSAMADTLIQIGGYPIVKFPQDSTLTFPTGYLFNLTPVITNASDANILPMKIYEWIPSDNINCNDALCSSPIAIIKNNVCYSVKATNIYGCSGSDTICIKTFCEGTQVFIPNAFTPKGGLLENSKFMIRASGISSVKSFKVFNRWGRVVFERDNFPPNSSDFGWDGTYNQKLADRGVYVYIAEVICENGASYFYKGDVTLL